MGFWEGVNGHGSSQFKMEVGVYTAIKDLNIKSKEVTIKARVTNIWENINIKTKEYYGLYIILLDESDTLIQGSIHVNEMSRFHPMLEEGSIHVLSKFRVIHSFGTYRATRNKFMISFCRQTQIRILQDYEILIPKYKFHYTAFSDLPSLSTNKTYLTDIVGIVKEIYPLELTANGQKSCPRRSLKLIDESNAELKATLWNKLAVELESKLQNQDPNNMVMIVTGVVINTFRGQFSASASTGSKVYINIEDSRVLELSHR
ncbi:uncharacterized protein LOC109846341 [Asparagus officinalis]|uniref:uncharacterized protein LOC109846341 n=1 Tax=Asparagus officinalis TaxID=4686 RepID=UPI00098DF188|nr:uncharacterized protein LOC109846341 [Asparagus officinalis]